MSAELFFLKTTRILDSNGIADGATLTFYDTGTLNKRSVYTTSALNIAHPNPLTVASGAAVPDIYLNSVYTYRCVVRNDDGDTIDDIDPYLGLSDSIVFNGESFNDFLTNQGLPEAHGVIDDNYLSDQTTAVQAWLTYCEDNRISPHCVRPIRARVTATLSYDPSALTTSQRQPDIDLSNLAIMTNQDSGLLIGSATGVIDAATLRLPAVRHGSLVGAVPTFSIDWSAGAVGSLDAGVVLYNCRACTIFLSDIRYFSQGIQYRSESYGFTENTVIGGWLLDNLFGEVLHNVNSNSYFNENKFFGGSVSYTNSSAAQVVPGKVAGTYLMITAGAEASHNNNQWYGRSYQMTDEVSHPSITESVPIWLERCGRNNHWHHPRCEVWRGPFMHVAGDGTGTTNATVGFSNEIHDAGMVGTSAGVQGRFRIRQVRGAYGNLLAVPNIKQRAPWSSGPLRDTIYSGGAADGARVKSPFFLRETTSATNLREMVNANRVKCNAYGVQWVNGCHFIMVRTDKAQDFEFWSTDLRGLEGGWFFQPLDETGAILCGSAGTTGAVDATYGNEKFVKFPGATASTLYGGGLITGTDNSANSLRLTVRDEVKFLVIGRGSGVGTGVISEFGFDALIPKDDGDGVSISSGALVVDPMFDAEYERRASANPGTSGTHGFYGRGGVVHNNAAASGVPLGWVSDNTGALGVAHANGLVVVKGQVAIASSKAYYARIGGTAGTGTPPTGTALGVDEVDGTVTWRYIGPKATFVALANIP